MTIEQVRTITLRASSNCRAEPYGEPTLEGPVWIVGFQEKNEIMALQVDLPDRECANENELYQAQIELMRRMQGAILMSS